MNNFRILLAATYFGIISLFFSSCSSNEEETDASLVLDGELMHDRNSKPESKLLKNIFKNNSRSGRDISTIKESGVLKAVTLYSSTGYFLYRGQMMGYEFELLEDLANYLDVELQIIVAKSFFEMLSLLNEGEVDLIAYGLTITKNRKQYVSFTDYLHLSHQVLVQRKPENWRKMKLHEIQESLISDNVELIGKTVSVRSNSSFRFRLENLMEELGDEIYIDTMSRNLGTERLIEMVVDGEIEYTMADNNIASINASYYPELDIKVPMSFSQRIAWAVNKNNSDLLGSINKWLASIKQKPDFNIIFNRYFENTKDFRKRLQDDYFSLESGRISQYDELIKKYADIYDLDWRMLSSVIYQESQFDPNAKSWAGAQGLMQLMPATAKELGVSNRANPDENLKGGINYLSQMWDNWKEISDTTQRTKFSLASYNCGYYHVRDAVRLAKKDEVNYLKWDDNVENYILLLSDERYFNDPDVHYGYVRGIEPYTYVVEIFERFEHYQKFVTK